MNTPKRTMDEERELLQKKFALERLEVAINTFNDDEACFFKLSDEGDTVTIYFMGSVGERERETINVSSSGVLMLYDVLHRVCSR